MDLGRKNTRRAIYPVIIAQDDSIEVKLPDPISDLIFDALGASHNPARSKKTFNSNLNASRNQVLTYLGTYFPRSLAESFVIFDSLLSDEAFAKRLTLDDCISICSVGTGTGGDLIGLLLALDKRLPNPTSIDIVSIEGNDMAHETMQQLLGSICPCLQSSVSLSLIGHVFEPPTPFDDLDAILLTEPSSFNFVISSKMLNELDSARVSKQPYYEFCDAFCGRLKPDGIMLVLDVTSPNGADSRWTPKLLNGQVNEFLTSNRNYRTILPLLCNRFENTCNRDCYTQNPIHVTYRNISYECSKVCYRVIGSAELAEELSSSTALWDCPITEDNKRYCQEFRE